MRLDFDIGIGANFKQLKLEIMKTIIFEGTEEEIKNLLLLIEFGSNDLPQIKT